MGLFSKKWIRKKVHKQGKKSVGNLSKQANILYSAAIDKWISAHYSPGTNTGLQGSDTQTKMLEFRSGRKSVLFDELSIEVGWSFGSAWPTWVSEVDAMQTKVFRVAGDPLKVVEQRPGRISTHITAIQSDCYKHTHRIHTYIPHVQIYIAPKIVRTNLRRCE